MKRTLLYIAGCMTLLVAADSCRSVGTTRKTGATDISRLADARWRPLVLYGKTVAEDTEAFISFATNDLRVGGNSGCNAFTGTCKLTEDGLMQFSQMVFTRKMCFGANIEEKFSAALDATVRFALSGDTLVFYDDTGSELCRFGK
ncbi:MAG: META domain-containing protein [Tannerella sp.]|jgi:heat shock protein HslJ|nr:META domain-containing protein [Tannerella sp.]